MDIYSYYVYIIHICNIYIHYAYTHNINIFIHTPIYNIFIVYMYTDMHSHIQDIYINICFLYIEVVHAYIT